MRIFIVDEEGLREIINAAIDSERINPGMSLPEKLSEGFLTMLQLIGLLTEIQSLDSLEIPEPIKKKEPGNDQLN